MSIPTQIRRHGQPDPANAIDICRISFGPALRLANILRGMAVALFVFGTIGSLILMKDAAGAKNPLTGEADDSEFTFAVAGWFSVLAVSALLAAAGHVLQILVGIYGQVFDSRFDGDNED